VPEVVVLSRDVGGIELLTRIGVEELAGL